MEDLVQLCLQYKPLIMIVVGIIVVTGGYIGFNYSLVPFIRGIQMRKARREFVQVFLTDKFVSDIEDAVLNGDITRDEATESYRDLKKCFPIENIFPATETLKDNIRSRMVSGIHAVVELPKPRRKHMFDKA